MKNKLMDLGLLWLRVMCGLGIMTHGWKKLVGEGGIAAWTERAVVPMNFPVPDLFGYLAVASELIGGFLLVLGLWSRYAAAAVASVVLTAFFIRHAADPFPRKELAAAYAVMAIAVLIMGPGRFAVDGTKSKGRSAPAKKGKA